MNYSNRRRFLLGLIVDWEFQSRYILNHIFLLLMFGAAITIFIYIGTWNGIVDAFSTMSSQNNVVLLNSAVEKVDSIDTPLIVKFPFMRHRFQALTPAQKLLLNKILLRVNALMIPLVIGLLAYIVMVSLIFSHRIAGPVFKMKRSATLISQGDLTVNFSLRKHDELIALGHELENALVMLRGSITNIQQNVGEYKAATSEEAKSKCIENIDRTASSYKTIRE
jgi:methyl-accepting chemotaxis protein